MAIHPYQPHRTKMQVYVILKDAQRKDGFWYMTFQGEQQKLMNKQAAFEANTLEEAIAAVKKEELERIVIEC